jgi:hypothetical protein
MFLADVDIFTRITSAVSCQLQILVKTRSFQLLTDFAPTTAVDKKSTG